MKHFAIVCLLSALCLVAVDLISAQSGAVGSVQAAFTAQADRAEGWREFSSADGSFTILFPGQPKRETGELFAESWLLKTFKHSANSGARYSVTYFNAPPLADRPDFALGLLKGLRSATLAEAKGQVLTNKEVMLEGHPGYFLEVVGEKGAITRTLLSAVGRRIYLLSMQANAGQAGTAADKFFGSFKPIPAKDREPDLIIGPSSKPMGGVDAGGRTPLASGIIQGKVRHMPEPEYPPIAKAARASGVVPVQVVVNEEGEVIAARPLAGHLLLQASAARAALRTRFSPTQLEGKPVKVSGVISFSFSLQ